MTIAPLPLSNNINNLERQMNKIGKLYIVKVVILLLLGSDAVGNLLDVSHVVVHLTLHLLIHIGAG